MRWELSFETINSCLRYWSHRRATERTALATDHLAVC